MDYFVLRLDERNKWSKLLSELPMRQQDIFYTPNYYEIFEKNGDGEATCFVYKDYDDISLYPFLKKSINELVYDIGGNYYDIQGAYGYNGIVSSSCRNEFNDGFHNAFNEYCLDNNIIAEFIRHNPIINNHLMSKTPDDMLLNRWTVALSLDTSYTSIWENQYTSANRNMINKGNKTLFLDSGTSLKHYDIFSEMYINTMTRVGADDYYFFDTNFFSNVRKIISDQCVVFIAYDKETSAPVGSILILIYKNMANYFLSARSALCQNNSATNFLLDEAIKYSRNKNCKLFHLGGGNSLDRNDTLFKFKKNFSQDIYEFYITKKIIRPNPYKKICNIWEKRNPDKKQKYKDYLLKYYQ